MGVGVSGQSGAAARNTIHTPRFQGPGTRSSKPVFKKRKGGRDANRDAV